MRTNAQTRFLLQAFRRGRRYETVVTAAQESAEQSLPHCTCARARTTGAEALVIMRNLPMAYMPGPGAVMPSLFRSSSVRSATSSRFMLHISSTSGAPAHFPPRAPAPARRCLMGLVLQRTTCKVHCMSDDQASGFPVHLIMVRRAGASALSAVVLCRTPEISERPPISLRVQVKFLGHSYVSSRPEYRLRYNMSAAHENRAHSRRHA